MEVKVMSDLVKDNERFNKTDPEELKCECAMCGVEFLMDKDPRLRINCCRSCVSSAVGTAGMNTVDAMVKEKLCSKCGGVGNFCNKIDNKSVCGLCQMEM